MFQDVLEWLETKTIKDEVEKIKKEFKEKFTGSKFEEIDVWIAQSVDSISITFFF